MGDAIIAQGWIVKKHRSSQWGGTAWRYVLLRARAAKAHTTVELCGFLADSPVAETAKVLLDWTEVHNLVIELSDGTTHATLGDAPDAPLLDGAKVPGPVPPSAQLHWLSVQVKSAAGLETFSIGGDAPRLVWLAKRFVECGVPFGAAGRQAAAAAVITPARGISASAPASATAVTPVRHSFGAARSSAVSSVAASTAAAPDALATPQAVPVEPSADATVPPPLLQSPPPPRLADAAPVSDAAEAAATAVAPSPASPAPAPVAAEPPAPAEAPPAPVADTVLVQGWVVKRHRHAKSGLLSGVLGVEGQQAWRYLLLRSHASGGAAAGARADAAHLCGFLAEAPDAETAKVLFDWTRVQNIFFQLAAPAPPAAGGEAGRSDAEAIAPLADGPRPPAGAGGGGAFPADLQWLTLTAPAGPAGELDAFALGAEPARVAWLAQRLLAFGVSFRGFTDAPGQLQQPAEPWQGNGGAAAAASPPQQPQPQAQAPPHRDETWAPESPDSGGRLDAALARCKELEAQLVAQAAAAAAEREAAVAAAVAAAAEVHAQSLAAALAEQAAASEAASGAVAAAEEVSRLSAALAESQRRREEAEAALAESLADAHATHGLIAALRAGVNGLHAKVSAAAASPAASSSQQQPASAGRGGTPGLGSPSPSPSLRLTAAGGALRF